MASAIEYTTIEQQITALKEKGLSIENDEMAARVLQRYGYYNVINSYKEPYQSNCDGVKTYIEGTTFAQIYSMFTLDHNLRNSTMAAMLELEECLRAAVAEVLAVNFGVSQVEYLNFRNYRDRNCNNPKFTLNAILGKLHNAVGSDKDPIRYYRERYNVVPPWILLKGTYFSMLINLVKYLKKEQKQQLMRMVLKIPADVEITDELTTLFQTSLYICLDYRNAAAHGGRIYNFHSQYTDSIVVTEEMLGLFPGLRDAENASGVKLLILLLEIFRDMQSYRIIKNSLNMQVNRHLQKYPEDMAILSESIGISIVSTSYVWVNEKTKKFHSNKECSGMSNETQTKIEDVDLTEYVPCKRCISIDEE